ncbi:MAG: hypothetical protein AAGD13_02220 [Pseudomonadota bacterium]
MADIATLATCIHVLDLTSLYVAFPTEYDTDYEDMIEAAERSLSDRLFAEVSGDMNLFFAHMHDGTRAAMQMTGAQFSDKLATCLQVAGRS